MLGCGISKGLCYARVLVLDDKPLAFPDQADTPEVEEKKFLEAQREVLSETEKLQEKTRRTAGNEAADILDVHCSLLKDSELVNPIKKEIAEGKSAAKAVDLVTNEIIIRFEKMENDYFAQRALDIKDVRERLIRKILCLEKQDLSRLEEPTIIAGNDITPSTTAEIDLEHVAGMLMEFGGPASHTAILAKTLEIPAIVGIKDLLLHIHSGDMVAFDGETGEIFTNLAEEEILKIENIIRIRKLEKEEKDGEKSKIALTKDGIRIHVFGNMGLPQEVGKILEKGGEGVGLFRSEFLFLSSRTLPSEEKQTTTFIHVLQTMQGKPVIIRTLDIGGDKEVPALNMKKEENPFLGLRAIRLCRNRQDIFRTQLRALLRASVYGQLRIMFPMISSLEELRWAKTQLELCRKELEEEGVPVEKKIPVGMMIEIPAAAIQADKFAEECDFFSVGTNDLTQYTLAVDRGNSTVSDLYTYFHPAVIALIQMAAEAAHRKKIPCGICGEAAGNRKMFPILLGMEMDELSMSAASIPEIKKSAEMFSIDECRKLVKHISSMETAEKIENYMDQFIKEKENYENVSING